jgi:hypothetical protein
MNKTQRIGLAIGGGVIAIGAAVGVGAMAANLANGGSNDQGMPGGYGQGPGGNRDQNGRPGGAIDTTAMAMQLATKLGVDEAKMKTSLDNALAAARPSGGGPGGMPSGAPSGMPSGVPSDNGQRETRRTEMLTAMATSIAKELNLDQATVLAALEEVWGTSGGFGGPSGQPTAAPTK